MMRARGFAALAAFLLTGLPAFSQTPVRDAAKPVASGTALLAGAVLTEDADPRPLRRVRVGLVSADRRIGRTTVTDDAGRFSFAGLPAGRYTLTATKAGYVPTVFGARRANRSGTAIVVADGQRQSGITIRMPRGAVITGIVTDQNGEPFSGANVNAMRYAYGGTGQRSLMNTASAIADDRGQYRIWGLAAGEYVVSANVGPASQGFRPDTEIARTTDADVKRALGELSAGPAAGPAAPGSDVVGGRPPSRTVGYAAVYYPGTFNPSQGTAVKVGAGEERAGIDFPLTLVPTAKVEGTIVIPEGVNPKSVSLQMVSNNPHGFMLDMFRRAMPAADGAFAFAGVPPGPYTIAATAQTIQAAAAAPSPGTQQRPTHWALADVSVDGQDISGVSLQLQLGMSISGRVRFEGTTAPPDMTRVRVSLTQPLMPGTVSMGVMAVQPDTTGAFTISGVSPGNYRLTANIPTLRNDTQDWQLKSSSIGGRETLDASIELRSTADDAAITFTDKVTELSGAVLDAAGQPAPEYHIVVFSSDRAHWAAASRRIRSVRPAADGKYQFPNLPPGDYLITAVTDLEPGEWFDPGLLDLLSRAAIKVTLSEGEKKIQDLRIAAQIP